MTEMNFARNTSSKRKAKRDQQYASTLVHYLGVKKALQVCKENTWTGVRQAIVEQQNTAMAG
jgi:hypothetical protein